jgi:elongation factor Ts
MANFSAADVKRLREQTGAGMLDCKNALQEADGDLNAAIEILRLKGVKDAGKRAARTAGNGLVTAELDGNSAGVLVELNCETDFVAKNEQFQVLAARIAEAALANKVADRLSLLTTDAGQGKTVEQLIEEASASIKEKIELGRYARFEGGYVSSYLHHSDRDLPPTLDVTAKERRIAEQITRDEGKPEQAISKIVEGRLGAFYKDVVLTEQAFVKEPKQSVAQVLKGDGVTVRGFARFQVGQA